MSVRSSFLRRFPLFAGFVLVLLAACGGNGGSGNPVTVVAPSALAYATNPAVYTLGQAILQNTPSHGGGAVDAYTVTPALSSGLSLNGSSGAISGTPTAMVAAASYTVTATNSAGSTTASLTITVNDAAPSSLVYTAATAAYTKGVAIPPNAPSHGGGAVISYSVSPSLPAGLSLSTSTGVVSGTPTAITASATYTVTATNSGGSATATLSLAVTDLPPTNLVYSAPTASYTVGTTIAPNLATHDGGAVVSFNVFPSLPLGLSFNSTTGSVTGTPLASAATTVYTVTAANSGGNATANLSLTVNDLPPTGLSYAFPTSIYTVGTAIAANAPNHGGGVVSLYSVSPALPAGLDLNASTGVVSGVPSTPAALAVYTITAANSGGSTTCGLSISVNPAVAGKAWYSATTLSLDNPGDALDPQLAFGGSGLATAVWEQSYGAGLGVWARRFTPGTGWAPAVRLEANATESAVSPRVAMDAAGNALVVWLQRDGTHYSIWARHFTVGSGWDGAVQLDSLGLGSMADLRVAMDAAGRGVAAWIQQGPVKGPLHSAQYQPGAGWSPTVEVLGDAGWIDLALNPSGAGMLVVSAADVVGTTAFSMWGIPFSTATGWGTAALLESDNTGGWDIVPSVAVDPSGRAVAVWQRFDSAAGRFNIRSNHFAPAGGWGTAELIETNILGFSRDPRIALDANGNGIAVWDQADAGPGGHIQIWSNRFTLGSGWGTAGLLENFRANDNYPAQYPQVAFDPAGDAFALWLDSGGDIQGVGYTLGTGWGAQRAMGLGTTQAPGAPQIAFDGNGNAFAIWHQVIQPSNLLQYSIWVSRYE